MERHTFYTALYGIKKGIARVAIPELARENNSFRKLFVTLQIVVSMNVGC
ncbi:MAG: hypothetical protein AB1638_11055 [Nitrospirota bacterium]